MKKLFLISMLYLLTACGSSSSGDGGLPTATETAPNITAVYLYDIIWGQGVIFTIGENFNYRIDASDPDLDMVTLIINEYFPSDSDTVYLGPIVITLAAQYTEEMNYFSTEPLEITGPAGNWRFEFQIEDAQSNESNIFRVYISVHED